ncbi:hypothetical protein ACHMW5_13455 [Azospirillum melinis]|uniref:hypothetical protein n=1 Tax=Azospirillum melinis TaxID=328839 RepID=UPI003757E569
MRHIGLLGIHAAMASLLMQERMGDEVITLKRADEIRPEPERRVSIIAPEPAEEPRRHSGKREAARRLRQLSKRSA